MMKFYQAVILVFIAGFIAGKLFRPENVSLLMENSFLVMLVFFASIEASLRIKEIKSFRKAFLGVRTLLFGILGSLITGLLFFFVLGKGSIPACMGLGWYTFTGPYLSALGGSTLGTIGFFSNLSRELFGIIAFPSIQKYFGDFGAVTYAGDPVYDVLFPFVLKYCKSEDSVIAAFVQGFLTGFVVPIIVPLSFILVNL
ncbi:MAG: hypothetical protein C0177_01460 [Fervidicoccus fontis]|uniref:Lysine exporter LysO family protein n=2 Tax=Fervidicoccus fontis TaxID=683846 RepID=A0A7C2VNR1_9CREN|nr:MAG: hypothetical protein C0177_01460 [Fervidicoccus fontis]HEW64434.1 lysine exporter LysO family protein [Fervidicoccus fontis]